MEGQATESTNGEDKRHRSKPAISSFLQRLTLTRREGRDEIFHRRSWWSERPVSSLSTTVLGLFLSSLSSTMSNNPPQSWLAPSTTNLRPKDEMRSLKAKQFLSSGFSRWILKSPVTNRVGDFMTNRPSRSENSEKNWGCKLPVL